MARARASLPENTLSQNGPLLPAQAETLFAAGRRDGPGLEAAAYAGMIQVIAPMQIASKAPINKSGHSGSRSRSEDFFAVNLGTVPNLTPMSAYSH
jgi:hypothetical protein